MNALKGVFVLSERVKGEPHEHVNTCWWGGA